MKRRNPAFIILIFLFWYYSTIRERKKPLLQDIFHKVRVTNLTQGGLKAMEELAKLEAERGNPEYEQADGGERRRMLSRQQEMEREEYGSRKSGAEKNDAWAEPGGPQSAGKKGKRERVASNEMCTFLILNISSLQLIPVNMIAYRQQYGSVNPAGIIAPAIVATFVSTAVAVVYCKVKDRKRRV